LKMTLSNYFSACLMMPYDNFLAAAKETKYDLEQLSNKFGASFEQICHRLTTLNRPGARGIAFFFLRVDEAGHISKRLSGGGVEFAKYGGSCSRWIPH
ncbi:MAG: short-chain fatty acyl-CoA regulator family protein, partial [Alphaproteobacteria bacterium]